VEPTVGGDDISVLACICNSGNPKRLIAFVANRDRRVCMPGQGNNQDSQSNRDNETPWYHNGIFHLMAYSPTQQLRE